MFAILFATGLAFANPDATETEPAEPTPTEEAAAERVDEEAADNTEEAAAPVEEVVASEVEGPTLSEAYAAQPPEIKGRKVLIAGAITSGVSVVNLLVYPSVNPDISAIHGYGIPISLILLSAGSIQMSRTKKDLSYFNSQTTDTTGGSFSAAARRDRRRATWNQLQGKQLVRRGTTAIVLGSVGLAIATPLTIIAASCTDDIVCLLAWAVLGGGSIIIAVPSIAMITVGSLKVRQGKQLREEAAAAVQQPPKFHASLVPMTTRNGAGLALQGRF
jgi:hypothetical protein